MSIDSNCETQMVTKLILQVSDWENCNRIVIPPEEGGLKEARDEENNIIISNSTLGNIMTPQVKKMYEWYKVLCGYKFFISAKSMH